MHVILGSQSHNLVSVHKTRLQIATGGFFGKQAATTCNSLHSEFTHNIYLSTRPHYRRICDCVNLVFITGLLYNDYKLSDNIFEVTGLICAIQNSVYILSLYIWPPCLISAFLIWVKELCCCNRWHCFLFDALFNKLALLLVTMSTTADYNDVVAWCW